MLRRPLRHRAAFSLVEVLVALFIVSAGLIALLSLFPLGAVQMGQAMRADRAAQCAMQADGKIREHAVSEYALDRWNIGYNTAGLTTSGTRPAVPAGVPNYPVLFDPIGRASYAAPRQTWVAGQVNGVARTTATSERRSGYDVTSVIEIVPFWDLPTALRYCTLPDDLEFAPDGTPADRDGFAVAASGQPVFRQGRYTWGALFQSSGTVGSGSGLKVLVFDRRPAGVDSLDAERGFAVNNVGVGETVIDLPAGIDTVPLRVGGWLFDGTVVDPVPANQFANPNAGTGIRNGNFYRVKSVVDVGGTVTRVELDTPIVRPTGNPSTIAYNAQFYVFADLIEVYDRPNLVPSGYQKQTP